MNNSTKIDYPTVLEHEGVSGKCRGCGCDIDDIYNDRAVFIDDYVYCWNCADIIMFDKKD